MGVLDKILIVPEPFLAAMGLREDPGFKDKGILVEHFRNSPDGRTLRTLELCHDHPAVIAAARMAAPRFETGINAAEVRSTTD